LAVVSPLFFSDSIGGVSDFFRNQAVLRPEIGNMRRLQRGHLRLRQGSRQKKPKRTKEMLEG